MVRLLCRDIDPLSRSHSETLRNEEVCDLPGARGLEDLPEGEVGEGGHGTDGEVVEELAPDLLPDLQTGLAGQPVLAEERAELAHPVSLPRLHLPHPGGEVGVGPDVAGALNIGPLGSQTSQHSGLPHQLGYELLVTQTILEGYEDRPLARSGVSQCGDNNLSPLSSPDGTSSWPRGRPAWCGLPCTGRRRCPLETPQPGCL